MEFLVAVSRLDVHRGVRDAGWILMFARDRARPQAIENSPSCVTWLPILAVELSRFAAVCADWSVISVAPCIAG